MTTAAPKNSRASGSGVTEDKRPGILAEIIGAAAAAGVIAQLSAYFVAGSFYSGYGLNASTVGITPINAAFHLSETCIFLAYLTTPPLIVVFVGMGRELRRIEKGDPFFDKSFLPIFHNLASWRYLRVALTFLGIGALISSTITLGETSARFGRNCAQGINVSTLTPHDPMPHRLIEKSANFALLPQLGFDLLPSRVEVSWPTIDKVPANLSEEWASGNPTPSSAEGNFAPSSGGKVGGNPPPGATPAPGASPSDGEGSGLTTDTTAPVPRTAPTSPHGSADASGFGEDPTPGASAGTGTPAQAGPAGGADTSAPSGSGPPGISTDDRGGFSPIAQSVEKKQPAKRFYAQWLGDNGNFHVLYFLDYRKTLFVKIDDVSMSVNLPISGYPERCPAIARG